MMLSHHRPAAAVGLGQARSSYHLRLSGGGQQLPRSLRPVAASPGQRDHEGAAPSSTTASEGVPPPAQPVAAPAAAPAEPAAPGGSSGAGIAAGAVLAAVAAFAATNLFATAPSLASLERLAVPLDVALSNGKPTVLEFYAEWCEVCKALVPIEYDVQKAYGDKVNFVMLNIENRKWAQEAADYRVGGIPHFVFLDKDGQPLAAAVGRLPRQVLEGNVSTLASGSTQLPYAAVRERTSPLTPPDQQDVLGGPKLAGPRDHA